MVFVKALLCTNTFLHPDWKSGHVTSKCRSKASPSWHRPQGFIGLAQTALITVGQRKDTWSNGRPDQYRAGSSWNKGSACWAVDCWKAQNNLQLVKESATLWLTEHSAKLEPHQQMEQYWILDWPPSYLSFIHFTSCFEVDLLDSGWQFVPFREEKLQR